MHKEFQVTSILPKVIFIRNKVYLIKDNLEKTVSIAWGWILREKDGRKTFNENKTACIFYFVSSNECIFDHAVLCLSTYKPITVGAA